MSTDPVTRSLLIVDDDPAVLATFRRITRDLAWKVRFARTSEEALVLCAAETPQLIISDYRLPGEDGVSFLEKVGERWPRTKRMLYTGEAINRIIYGFDVPVLAKPCEPHELHGLLRAIDGDLNPTLAEKIPLNARF